MKKTILFSLLALLGMTQAVAQEYEYVPFVREGVKWVYRIKYHDYDNQIVNNPALGNNTIYRTLELKGDTVINGKTYKAMHKYSGDAINEENDTVPIYLREEDKVVYGIVPDGKTYSDCPIVKYYNFDFQDSIRNGMECVIYDFRNPLEYWNELVNRQNDGPYYSLNLQIDTITIGSHLAKRYVGEDFGDFEIIECIGLLGSNSYTLGLFMPIVPSIFAEQYSVEKIVENGEVIYPHNFIEDRYLPIIREGVKWVNERVTVNDGDTTCCYYCYYFKDNYPTADLQGQVYKAVYHRNEGAKAGPEQLIAGLREGESKILSIKNEALNKVIEEDRNLMDFYENSFYGYRLLYDMFKPSVKQYYIDCQRESFLNQDNFVEVEPLEIEGVRCNRFAYIGEDGEVLAYVVEGIGFDSYDMGDLLTPFTRKPDPNADYQEWCGLSHVVKDGKIIYKGMRYRHGAFDGIDEVVADKSPRPQDDNYYNLMGQPVGKDVPTAPGIYIHQGKKIIVR